MKKTCMFRQKINAVFFCIWYHEMSLSVGGLSARGLYVDMLVPGWADMWKCLSSVFYGTLSNLQKVFLED